MDPLKDIAQSSPPGNTGDVWPPAIFGTEGPNLVVPFKTLFLCISGSVPDFRSGHIEVGHHGVIIHGKAVLSAETQVPFLIAAWFVLLFLPTYLALEQIRSERILNLTWDQIHEVVMVLDKRQLCLIYDAPNDKGFIKTYSLAFKLTSEQHEAFIAKINDVASQKLYQGQLRSWRSPGIVILFVGICMILLNIFAFFASLNSWTH